MECPRGEIGRHKGLKILALLGVPVRVWPRAPLIKYINAMNILFFGRKFDSYSKNLLQFLRKNNNKVDVFLSDGKTNKLKKHIKKKYDFIICFRSHFLLKEKHLKAAKIAAINFHPGPPKYRGVGCVNSAILNGEKSYGTTAHLINNKIDNGKIIDVKYFRLNKKDKLDVILKKTHKNMLHQSKNILNKIFKKPNNIKFLTIKNSNIKWSKKLMTRKKLNKLYQIDKNISKENLKKAIRALNYKDFKPYIKIDNFKFMLN